METTLTGTETQAQPDGALNTGVTTTGTPPAAVAAPSSATPTPAPAPAVSMTQEALDRLIEGRLAADRRARDAAAHKKAQEEAGEFRPLYEQEKAAHEAAGAERDALAARVTAYEAAEHARITAAIAGWPKAVTAGDPGPTDLAKRQTWYAAVAPEVAALTGAPLIPPIAPTPAAPGANDAAARHAQAGLYGRF